MNRNNPRRDTRSFAAPRADNPRACAPAMEALESRTLLNAAVTYAPTQITIQADNAATSLTVTKSGGYYNVTGNPGTTITTKGTPPPVSTAVSITIKAGTGDTNSFLLDGLSLKNLTFTGKTGMDRLFVGNGTAMVVAGNVTAVTGDNADRVSFSNGTYTGKVTLILGNGNDYIEMSEGANVFHGAVNFDLGADSNRVSLSTTASSTATTFNSTFSLKGGSLDDRVDMASGSGVHNVTFNGSVKFDLGAGDDQFNVNSTGGAAQAIFKGRVNQFLFGAGANGLASTILEGALFFVSTLPAKTSVSALGGQLTSPLLHGFLSAQYTAPGELSLKY